MPYYNRDPNRDHNFDSHPVKGTEASCAAPEPRPRVKTEITEAEAGDAGTLFVLFRVLVEELMCCVCLRRNINNSAGLFLFWHLWAL